MKITIESDGVDFLNTIMNVASSAGATVKLIDQDSALAALQKLSTMQDGNPAYMATIARDALGGE